MKNLCRRLLALTLALCFALSLVACNGEETETKPKKETETESATESMSETESKTETEAPEIPEDAVCYIGESEYDPDTVFYNSIEAAIAANPNGADITFCKDMGVIEGVIELPEGADYIIRYDNVNVTVTFSRGFLLESGDGDKDFTLYTSEELLYQEFEGEVESRGLHNKYLWFFTDADGHEPGKYIITDKNVAQKGATPEYSMERVYGLDMWGKKPVASVREQYNEVRYYRYYYTLQDALDSLKPTDNEEGVNKVYIVAHYPSGEQVYEVPYDCGKLRLPYDFHLLDGSFNYGFTYDDNKTPAGYTYYNDLMWVSSFTNLENTYLWVWSDYGSSMKPGKYYITLKTDEEKFEFDPETGLYTTMTAGLYTYIWIAPIEQFREEILADFPDLDLDNPNEE